MAYNLCGRVHLGPCLVNGRRSDGSEGPTCMACGKAMTQDDRILNGRMWDRVRAIAAVAGAKMNRH